MTRKHVSFPIAATAFALVFAWLAAVRPVSAYVEVPYTLGRVIAESTNIVVMRVEQVDRERNIIVYRKIEDLKGKHPTEIIRHNIGRGGFHPREWQITMEWAAPGKIAVFFHNGGASETCIDMYWYQCYGNGDNWSMSHAEPYLLRSYAGRADRLVPLLRAMLAGQEVVVPCMVDGDKNALQLRTARIQRMKASLKLLDYHPQRDFVGWGGLEDVRPLAGWPGFKQLAVLPKVAAARGVALADFTGDNKPDLCIYGDSRVSLIQNEGNAFAEASLPYTGPARSAEWADYTGDGKPDLLLATPTGPRIFANLGQGRFREETVALPVEPYPACPTAVWLDYDNDGKADVVSATSFHGLRVYRNLGNPQGNAEPKLRLDKWYLLGPFDNADGRGFHIAYPPEQEIALDKEYVGKRNAKVRWRELAVADGQVHSLLPHFADRTQTIAYLYRAIHASHAVELPIALGSDDTLTVWLNGEKIVEENVYRPCAPDQTRATLKLKPGVNHLLLKIGQGDGEWAFYFRAEAPQQPVTHRFEDVSERVGLGPNGLTASVRTQFLVTADFDTDGRQDLLVCGDRTFLLLNKPEGFRIAENCGLEFRVTTAKPFVTDLDGDKRPDVLVPQSDGCRVFRNLGSARFADITAETGALAQVRVPVQALAWGEWSTNGRPDLFLGCVGTYNRILRQEAPLRFVDISEELRLYQRIFQTRATAVADLNGDRAPDWILINDGQDSVVLFSDPNYWATKMAQGENRTSVGQ
ncbi:MAG: VCBS repeat-containing protein [Gemmatales bacterium]|nr:VCBS repeat-containing protein [Gemmatales bacterium]